MGLDNYPKTYPCLTKGTAVKVSRRDNDGNDIYNEDGTPDLVIDCQITMDAGGCPWKNANPPGRQAYGMFGCPCWYRGKYGNTLLREYTDASTVGDDESFYGDNEDGTEKSPESCIRLADLVAEVRRTVSDEDHYESLVYAEWYMRWAATECDGLVCWY